MAKNQHRFREVKMFFTLLIGLTAIGICGYLLYLFHTIDFLPFLLNLVLRSVLAFTGIAAAIIMIIHMKHLNE